MVGKPTPRMLTLLKGVASIASKNPNIDHRQIEAMPPSPLRRTAHMEVACSSCSLRELCLPVGFSAADMERLDGLVSSRRSLRRGEALFRRNDAFTSIYAIRTGFFKTCMTTEEGRDHVSGFLMAGDLMGFDGIGHERHSCDAVALEDSQVCIISYSKLEEMSREFSELQRQVHRIMSREIVREHGVMVLLSGMRAEERVAAFLANLAQRLEARGFSSSSFVLRMTRQEIGTYLGLKLETVSRCFSKLCDDGILEVQHRQVRIVDHAALQQIVSGATA
jgi:CRP/FNR family transcriptional regulator, anaerobic regulatory protein